MPKWLRVVLYVVVGAFLFYLIAANILLGTHLLRGWISSEESKLKLDYRNAWSLYPGHVELRDVSLRHQDTKIQMLIRAERATLQIDPLALTKHTLRLSKLTTEGTSFRMREKVKRVKGLAERVRAFPPIEGFADPPIEHNEPKAPTGSEPWAIDLADISASLREVWTMEFRYRGEGTLRGGFKIGPKHDVRVLPSMMLTHGGVLSLGNRDLVRGGDTRIDAEVAPFDVGASKGPEVLRHLSVAIHQHGELVLPAVAATYLPEHTKLQLTRGTGPVTVDLAVEHGVLQPSTRVVFHTKAVAVKARSLSMESDLRLAAHVTRKAKKSTVILEASVGRATSTPLEIQGVRAMVDLGNADLVAPFGIARASGVVTSAQSRDLRAWQPIAPAKISFDGGSATFSAHGEYRQGGALDGRLDLALDNACMTVGGVSFVSSGKVWSRVTSEDIAKALAFPDVGADLHDIVLRLPSSHVNGLWIRSRLSNTTLSTSPFGLDTDIAVDAGPGDRTLELVTRLASIPDFPAKAVSGSHLAASLQLGVRPGTVALAVTGMKNGTLEGRGRMVKRSGTPLRGAFLVGAGLSHTGLDLHGGRVSVVPLAGGEWLDKTLQQH
jgi:hypothetical protein